jgi:hypothetical protein
MSGSLTPFPWWLWILAGLWAGCIVLRGVWSGSREGRRFLDVLVGVYTILLAYMVATATTADTDRVSRMIAWTCGALALGGGLVCLLATTHRWRTGGWLAATLGVAGLSLTLAAPELAALCAAAGVIGAVRQPLGHEPTAENDPVLRDPWLVAVFGAVVCAAWLGAIQYALRMETQRGGLSRRETVLPAATVIEDESTARRWPITGMLLAGVILALTVRESRPRGTESGEPAA